MALDNLNRVKYTGLDFDTHFDDLRAQLQTNYTTDFNDFALSSLGIMLLDLVSYGLDALSFYQDRRATEVYLSTARTRKAVSRICRQLGYKMAAAIASSVDLSVTLQAIYAFDVPIPKGFQFQGPNDLIYEVAQTTTFTAGSGPTDTKSIPCYEGESVTETFVSDGSANQLFELRRVPDQKFVVFGTVAVTVNGAAFTESMFLTVEATDQFEVNYNDEPPTIRFGDGTAGNIPAVGASIVVSYVATRGKAGQVGKDTIQSVVTPLVVNFTQIPLTVNNSKAAVGGDDPEDIEHAKSFAGRFFKTREVAVTRSDYETLAGAFADPLAGRVAVAQAFSPRSSASDLTLQNYLSAINTVVATSKPTVDTNTTAIETALSAIDAALAALLVDLNDIGTLVTDANTQADTAVTSARAARNLTNEIEVNATDIQSQVVSGKAAVDAITTAGSSQLTTGDKDIIKKWFDQINGEAGQISSAANSIETSANSEIAAMGVVKDKMVAIGLSVASGELLSANTQRLAIVAQVGIPSPASGIRLNVDNIQAIVVDVTTSVVSSTDSIEAHFDKILAADCKANLVTVPILARDAAGFYAAPSTALIQALQSYLDARKEVTQTVSVTSGELFLIRAVLTVRVGIKVGISAQVIRTAVETAVDGVLRGRKFGAALYQSDLVNGIKNIEGVTFTNVTINGHYDTNGITVLTTKLDSTGNLVILNSEVITKGLVTVLDPEVQVTT